MLVHVRPHTQLTITDYHNLRASQVDRVLPGQIIGIKILEAVQLGLDDGPVAPVDRDVVGGGEDEGAGVSLSVAAQYVLCRLSNVKYKM